MRKAPVLLTLVLLSPLALQAQTKESKVSRFHGGNLDFRLGVSTAYFYGMGGPSSILGGLGSRIDASNLYGNPATLGQLGHRSVFLDLTPPVSTDVSGLLDLNGRVAEAVDDGLEGNLEKDAAVDYPKAGLDFGQGGALSAGAAAIALPKGWTVAIGYSRPFNVRVDALTSGFESTVITQVTISEGKRNVIFNSFVDTALEFRLDVSAVSFSAAKRLALGPARPGPSVGISLSRYRAEARIDGHAAIDGLMIFGGQEHIFNNPADPWPNDLTQSIRGRYAGGGWGVKLGAFHPVNSKVAVQAVVNLSFPLGMTGDLDIVQNRIPALDLDALFEGGAEQEILDPAKLKLTQLTLTERVAKETYRRLQMRFPHELTLGVAGHLGLLEGAFHYTRYLSDLSFQYGPDRVGVEIEHGVRLGLDFRYARLGLGLLTGHETRLHRGREKSDRRALIVPLASIGGGVTFLHTYELNLQVVAVPSPMLRASFGLSF